MQYKIRSGQIRYRHWISYICLIFGFVWSIFPMSVFTIFLMLQPPLPPSHLQSRQARQGRCQNSIKMKISAFIVSPISPRHPSLFKHLLILSDKTYGWKDRPPPPDVLLFSTTNYVWYMISRHMVEKMVIFPVLTLKPEFYLDDPVSPEEPFISPTLIISQNLWSVLSFWIDSQLLQLGAPIFKVFQSFQSFQCWKSLLSLQLHPLPPFCSNTSSF